MNDDFNLDEELDVDIDQEIEDIMEEDLESSSDSDDFDIEQEEKLEAPKESSNSKPSSNSNSSYKYNNSNYKNNYKKQNYKKSDGQNKPSSNWGKKDFGKLEITTSMFNSNKTKTFVVIDNGDITDEALTTIMNVVKNLYRRGYRYRTWINERNRTDTVIRTLEESGGNIDVYRIFKPTDKRPANTDPNNCTVISDTIIYNDKAYEIACNYDRFFEDRPPIIQTIKSVIVQTVLGKELNEPVDFAIVYTKCGKTAIDKDYDYKAAKDVADILRYCKDGQIPVFNVGNPKFKEEFVSFMKTISDNNQNN